MFGVDWMGLALPFAYLLVLGGALMTFSTIYRKRKAGRFPRTPTQPGTEMFAFEASSLDRLEMLTRTPTAESANLAPWFGPNLQRNVYLSLLHLGPEDGNEKSPRVPDSVLKAALLRRAVEDIERLIQIKTAKQACSSLLLRGSVGDDLWQRFQRAEKEMEEELRDVVTEVRRGPRYHRDCGVMRDRLLTFACRPMPWRPTGVQPSSSRRTRSPPTPSSAKASGRSKPRPNQRSSGGRSGGGRSRASL